jgi:hypothetical protein
MNRTCLLLALVTGAPVAAAEADSRLPANTDVVVSVNLEQLLGSPLGKKYLRKSVEEALKSSPAGETLKQLQLDPLKDINRVTLALSSGNPDSGLIIIQGKLNRGKIADLAEKVAADHPDKLKIHKSVEATVYEFPGDKTVFATFSGDSVLLLSNDREALTGKPEKPKKELVSLIEKVDAKQAAWLVMLPAATKTAPGVEDEQKRVLERLEGIYGVLKVQSGAKLELTLITQSPQVATSVAKIVVDWVATAKTFGTQALKDKPELGPLLEVVYSVNGTVRGKNVYVTAEVSAEQIEKAVKAFGGDK